MQKDIETLISSNLHSGISAVESWQQFFSSTFKLLLLVSLFYHYYGIIIHSKVLSVSDWLQSPG